MQNYKIDGGLHGYYIWVDNGYLCPDGIVRKDCMNGWFTSKKYAKQVLQKFLANDGFKARTFISFKYTGGSSPNMERVAFILNVDKDHIYCFDYSHYEPRTFLKSKIKDNKVYSKMDGVKEYTIPKDLPFSNLKYDESHDIYSYCVENIVYTIPNTIIDKPSKDVSDDELSNAMYYLEQLVTGTYNPPYTTEDFRTYAKAEAVLKTFIKKYNV